MRPLVEISAIAASLMNERTFSSKAKCDKKYEYVRSDIK